MAANNTDFTLYFASAQAPLTSFQWGDFPFMIHSMRQEACANQEQHWHNFVELVYIRGGSGFHVHAGRTYAIFAGDCFVILPGEPHSYGAGTNLSITNILFYPEMLAPHRSELLEIPGFAPFFSIEPLFRKETSFRYKLHLSLAQQKSVLSLLDRLEAEYRARQPGGRAACLALLLEVVVALSRGFGKSIADAKAQQAFSAKKEAVDAAISFLEQNHGKDIRLDEIAKSAFMSSSRLSHVFKEVTGTSLFDYLSRIRVERACQILAESAMPLPQLAATLGFHDPSYFGRLFRKHTGLSPSAFRRQQKSPKK